jgi:hypothetical protein
MTGGMPAEPASQPRPGAGWRDATPEIIIAVTLVAAAGIAGYALAGAAAPAIVAIGAAVIALVAFRGMLPPDQAPPPRELDVAADQLPASFTGFWRKRAGLADGTRSAASYDATLRPTLQHLLAARLAERHGISLRDDPDQARRLLCPGERDDGLWYWVDPARQASQPGPASQDRAGPGSRRARRRVGRADSEPGIPPRTLARLIDRLERL